MPKGFSEKEKEQIQKTLIKEATVLFERYGIQKTTVEDIVKAAGISKGSFYIFYKSKEELFFDILESMENKFKNNFFDNIFPESSSRRESFKNFLDGFLEIMEKTSIINLFNPSDYQYLLRKLPEHRKNRHIQHDYEIFREFYRKWHKNGVFRDLNIKGFTGVMKLLFYFFLHKDEYPEDEFLATKNIFIDMLSEYIVIE